MADLFKLLQPLQFMQSFLKKGLRPDGRKFDQYRKILISCNCISTANGSALVKLGTSSVMCGIQTSLVKPPADEPEQGALEVSVKFSNICSTDLDNPDRSAIADYVRECVRKVLSHARVLDLESLCVIARKSAWKIELELVCLNLNGAIVDMALIAAICALKFCKLRKYDVDLELDLATPTDSFYPLAVNSYPVFATFSLIDGHLLIDPAISEEELSHSLIRIAVDSESKDGDDDGDGDNSGAIYFLEFTGTAEIDCDVLQRCYRKAIERARFIRSLILERCADSSSISGSIS